MALLGQNSSNDLDKMSQKFLAMSSSPANCDLMRSHRVVQYLVQILHGKFLNRYIITFSLRRNTIIFQFFDIHFSPLESMYTKLTCCYYLEYFLIILKNLFQLTHKIELYDNELVELSTTLCILILNKNSAKKKPKSLDYSRFCECMQIFCETCEILQNPMAGMPSA